MPTQFVFATAVFTWIVTAVQAKPAVYPNWPACKTDTEYVTLIPKSERVTGTVYHEHKTHRDTVKFYLCKPCTLCLSGIEVLSPCSVRTDTQCSTMCAMAGCVLDDLLGCILPGDPNDFINLAAMMDPCDPTMSKVTTPSNVVRPIPDNEASITEIDERPTTLVRTVEKKAEGTSSSKAPVGVQTYVFAVLIGVLFIMSIGIICYTVGQNRNKNDVMSVKQRSNTIEMRNFSSSDRRAKTTSV